MDKKYKYDLTVLMPAIRVERWIGVYDSISKSFSGSWELIIITEKEVPEELKNKDNVKIVFSERSPMQKQQQALNEVEGRYVTVMSDDQLWYPGKLDEAFKLTDKNDHKKMVIMKYTEGPEFNFPDAERVRLGQHVRTNYDWMGDNRYYIIQWHSTCELTGMPKEKPAPVTSTAFISTKLLLETGGWDCQFQVQGIGNCDHAMRMINHGCTFEVFGGPRVFCSYHGYMEEGSGDHGPLHGAILDEDIPLLETLYSVERPDRVFIELDNWKRTPAIWKRKPKTPDNTHLSIVCPGIRPGNWKTLYDSILLAFSGNFELIFLSPNELPPELKGKPNVRLIKTFRNPIACQQWGLVESKGKYFTWVADDAIYLPGSLDDAWKLLEGKDYKTFVIGRYIEGSHNFLESKMDTIIYYTQHYHFGNKVPGLPKEAYIFNVGLATTQLMKEMGGWDAENFEVCPMSCQDLSVRLQKFGAKPIVQEMLMLKCSHMPERTGDHGPIHDAQTQWDEPKYHQMHNKPNSRVKIDLMNYLKSPERWGRRFK